MPAAKESLGSWQSWHALRMTQHTPWEPWLAACAYKSCRACGGHFLLSSARIARKKMDWSFAGAARHLRHAKQNAFVCTSARRLHKACNLLSDWNRKETCLEDFLREFVCTVMSPAASHLKLLLRGHRKQVLRAGCYVCYPPQVQGKGALQKFLDVSKQH